ncbi:MAG TPA: type II secretion system protein [Gemmatimonadales bacterium]|nr:type II secretion system protein [Gemmatimonadales bacterium]HRZ10022.1 type II secretion system protein [Gemmatimonadales bacterium]
MRSRSGFALLEAIIALAILGTAGLSLVALIRSGLEGERRTRGEEKLMASASRVLTAMALLTREDLDRRLGTHAVGEFSVEVQRPEQALYRLAIAAADRSSTELLVTVVYRP